MEDEVKHPLFARFYMRIATSAEDRYRRETLQGLSGQVVEVGAGHGPNFAFYPETVERVLAVEPEPTMRAKAQEAARKAPVPIDVTDGVAAKLPVDSNSFDAAVACLFLCSVPDQRAALAEFHRVLKPGGELRYYEHVASHRSRMNAVQRFADATVWPHLAGGCHLARDTRAAITAAGFEITTDRLVNFPPGPAALLLPHVLGTARRV